MESFPALLSAVRDLQEERVSRTPEIPSEPSARLTEKELEPGAEAQGSVAQAWGLEHPGTGCNHVGACRCPRSLSPGVHTPSPKFPVEQDTYQLTSGYKRVGEIHQLWAHCAGRSLPSSQVGRAPHFRYSSRVICLPETRAPRWAEAWSSQGPQRTAKGLLPRAWVNI